MAATTGLLQFSTVIGTYLFAMGVGSWLSRYFERQLPAHFLRIELLVALVGGTFLAAYLLPSLGKPTTLVEAPHWFTGGTPIWIAVSGLLTGFGTKIGNGCTSGHGVCGLARLSTRSFVAVGVFFVVAILTVTITGIV